MTDERENFGETPEDFDLDAWIAQGTRPRRTIGIFRDWSLMDDLTRLEEQIAGCQDDESMVSEKAALVDEYERVVDRISASRLEVTVQALTAEEISSITAGVPDLPTEYKDSNGETIKRTKSDVFSINIALTSAAIVRVHDPASGATRDGMTRDQLKQLREHLGDGPFNALYEGVVDLIRAGKEIPSAPFLHESSGDSLG